LKLEISGFDKSKRIPLPFSGIWEGYRHEILVAGSHYRSDREGKNVTSNTYLFFKKNNFIQVNI
jgi:hypothetical protein